MFDIGWGELVVIGVVALIAIGPKELPGVLRMAGQWIGKVRRMAAEFQGQFQEAMREAEMADLKKQVDEMTASATDFANIDPLEDVRSEFDGLGKSLEFKPAEDSAAPGEPAPDARPAPTESSPPEPAASAEVTHMPERAAAEPPHHAPAETPAPDQPMPKSAAGG